MSTEGQHTTPCAIKSIEATRHPNNPMIHFGMSPVLGEKSINGPSVIRVPEWLPEPMGRYYMYFADHGGPQIHLAYADSPAGPWTIHEPGVLNVEQSPVFQHHIASPDVLIDDDARQIRMYYHGPGAVRPKQWSSVALSDDGLNFSAPDVLLGKPYFRVWQWDGWYYSIAKDHNAGWGELARSRDGLAEFEKRGPFISMIRHLAVLVRGETLIVFYSRALDEPERIVGCTVDMRGDWADWTPSEVIEVLEPEAEYEGIQYPIQPSSYGGKTGVRQLRDPGVFEEDGRTYLYYSYAGEEGIAMAALNIEMR